MSIGLHVIISPYVDDYEYYKCGDEKFCSDFVYDYWHMRCVPYGFSYMFLFKYFYIE